MLIYSHILPYFTIKCTHTHLHTVDTFVSNVARCLLLCLMLRVRCLSRSFPFPQLVLCSVVFYVCLGYLQQTINQHIAAFCLWLQLPLDTLHPLDTFAF